jgi:hypothetical protein
MSETLRSVAVRRPDPTLRPVTAGARQLDWDGCVNVRDLGGLPTGAGRLTRFGAVVRAGAVDRLSAAGWRALEAHGIRTVIDLRNDDEHAGDAAPRPAGIETVLLPLDGVEDTEFWAVWGTGPQFGTPLYYRPFLDRFPERAAGVVRAIARARPGGVLFHCAGGRDRTGLITALVLTLAGVLVELLAGLDVEAYLRAAGVDDRDLEALRARLVGEPGTSGPG